MTLARTLLSLVALLAALPGAGQPYPPEWRWRTTETEHFRIHFHEGTEWLAAGVARAAERAHATLAPVIGHAPRRRTEVVISDGVDDANGSASPVPYNTIRLYGVAPSATSELSDEREWLDAIVLHEYVHILHIDTVLGFPAVLNQVFGRLFFPNGLVPAWMIEGLAVTHEAEGDAATGRNVSAFHDMYIRAQALDGGLPRLDQISNPALDWPLGQVPYVLGGRFMAWLDTTYGRAAVVSFLRDQGGMIWPYAPSWPGRRWFGGKSFLELWRDYGEVERGRAEAHLAAVRARPAVPFTAVTQLGARVDNPRFTPDGKALVFFHRSLHERAGLFRVALDGGEPGRVAPVDLDGTFALRSADRAIVAETEIYREFRSWNDLWAVDLRTGRRVRLTEGERASEPDVRDGTLVYVRHTGDGGMALLRRAVFPGDALGPAEVLFEERGADVFNPRLSPDGKRVAFSLRRGGRLDLALLEDGQVRTLTDDDALDLTPAWTPDGATLLFASDRGGAFDVHAVELATGTIRRVTNAESGALWPDVSPDGRTLAFLTYGRAGYDVATLPLDPAAFAEASPVASEPRPASLPPLAPLPPSRSRPYSALGTLGPSFWFPVFGSDAEGPVYGTVTGGADALLRHVYVAQAWWSEGARTPGYALTYQGRWSWPQLDLASSRSVGTSPDPVGRTQTAWTLADAGATFSFTSVRNQLTLRLGWSGTLYDTVGKAPARVAPPELRFEDGLLSQVTATLAYTDARRYVRSISAEEGRSFTLSLRVADRTLGSDFTLARARASATQFLRVPWTRHGVLMLRLSGGVAHGSLGGREPFTLGGPVVDLDVLSYLLGSIPDGGTHSLRGYAPGALGGSAFGLGTTELRFPLFSPLLGRSTWPLFLRRVHGAVFADAGEAFDLPGELRFAGTTGRWEDLRIGVGAELRLEMVFAYWLRTELRLGAARPLGPVEGGRARDLRELGEAPAARFYVTLVAL